MKTCFLTILVLLTATPTLAADRVVRNGRTYAFSHGEYFNVYSASTSMNRGTLGDRNLLLGECTRLRRKARRDALQQCRQLTTGTRSECTVFETDSDRGRPEVQPSLNWRGVYYRGCSFRAYVYNPSEAPIDL